MPQLGDKHYSYNAVGIAAYRRAKKKAAAGAALKETLYTRVKELVMEKDWIQGAVDPSHKGFCTPMTKSTCTPARKSLAKRFKKAGRNEKKTGGTGWEGKV